MASYHSITFNVRGYKHFSVNGVVPPVACPGFVLGAKGVKVDYDCGPEQETWGIIVRTNHWRKSRKKDRIDIRFGDAWTAVPLFMPLEPEQVTGWQQECARMRAWFLNPIPLNIIRLELGVMNLFRFFLNCHEGVSDQHLPAHRLKALLDSPESRDRSLQSMTHQTGYSPEHMRALFQSAFGVSPIEYRMRCRMAQAMDHVTNSRLSVKEIAFRLGFKYLSHFSRSFRKAFGMSVREAIAKCRHESGV